VDGVFAEADEVMAVVAVVAFLDSSGTTMQQWTRSEFDQQGSESQKKRRQRLQRRNCSRAWEASSWGRCDWTWLGSYEFNSLLVAASMVSFLPFFSFSNLGTSLFFGSLTRTAPGVVGAGTSSGESGDGK
jgi:hypothetical protein